MADFGFLLGAQPVQLPDPVAQAQRMMTLAQISNSNQLAQYNLAKAQRADAAARATGQALGSVNLYDDNSVQQALQGMDPDARQAFLQTVLAARKEKAATDKSTAEAGKNTAQTTEIKAKLVGGLAYNLANKPDVSPQDVMAANAIAQRSGLNVDFMPPPGVDPKAHWQSLAAQSMDAVKQADIAGQAQTRAETNRHNVTTEGLTGTRDANTAAYQQGELGVRNAELQNSNMRARAAMVQADPFGLSGLNTGAMGGAAPGMPAASTGPAVPQGVNPGDAELFKTALADAQKNGYPQFKVGGQTFSTADVAGPVAPAQGTMSVQQAMQADVHGDQFLASLPGPLAGQVKALAEGRMAFPTGAAFRSPQTQQMLQLVAQYDPTFDAVNYAARNKTRSNFAGGKDADTTAALNQLAGHLDRFVTSSQALNNGSFPLVNQVANAVLPQVGDTSLDARLKQYGVDRQAVIAEAERVFRGTGGSESDLKRWKDNFDSSSSPQAQQAALEELVHLIGSRIDAQVTKYQSGMGTTKRALPQLTPAAAATYRRYGVDISADNTTDATTAQGGTQDKSALLMQARDAISKGADPAKVKARLQQLGVTDTP